MLISINEAQMSFKELIEKIKKKEIVGYADFIGTTYQDLKGANYFDRQHFFEGLKVQFRLASIHIGNLLILPISFENDIAISNTQRRLADIKSRYDDWYHLMTRNSSEVIFSGPITNNTEVTFSRPITTRPITSCREQPSYSDHSSSR